MSQRIGEPSPRIVASEVRAFSVAGSAIAYVTGSSDPGGRLVVRNADGSATSVADYADTVTLSDGGRFVFWTDARQQPAPGNDTFELLGHDLAANSRFVALSLTRAGEHRVWLPSAPDSEAGVVVWILQEWADDIPVSLGNYLRYRSEVHAAPIADLLPSAPREDPGATDPNWTWFPETSHYLSGAFRSTPALRVASGERRHTLYRAPGPTRR
jgi:hypothetical protein